MTPERLAKIVADHGGTILESDGERAIIELPADMSGSAGTLIRQSAVMQFLPAETETRLGEQFVYDAGGWNRIPTGQMALICYQRFAISPREGQRIAPTGQDGKPDFFAGARASMRTNEPRG